MILPCLILLIFLLGLYFYAKQSCGCSNSLEGFTNAKGQRCPNMLIQKGSKFYLYSDTGGYRKSGTSLTNQFIFDTLSADTYYVIGDDGGGCTGITAASR